MKFIVLLVFFLRCEFSNPARTSHRKLENCVFSSFFILHTTILFLATKEGMLIIKLFDEIYPENGISDVKRLTLLCGKISDGENNINLIII